MIDASFRLVILALHKTARKEYAPTTKPEFASWLIRTLSGKGFTPQQMTERNTPGESSARFLAVRTAATRIFTLEDYKLLNVMRGGDGFKRETMVQLIGTDAESLPHLLLEVCTYLTSSHQLILI